jgi:hypothetical protein
MDMDYNIKGVHYLVKKENKDYENIVKWIYINLLINNYKTDIKIIKLILNDIIYDIKTIENENLKKRIIKFLPTIFFKYKKYNKLCPNIV